MDPQIALRENFELLEEIINPAVLEARSQIAEDLTEMREQLQKQVGRLRELRIKKAEEPGTLIVFSFSDLPSAKYADAP
jgi:elongator complex protein 1